ncbi:MAG: ElyC/SanA/YdcF family protein [Anaerolineae bacterium]
MKVVKWTTVLAIAAAVAGLALGWSVPAVLGLRWWVEGRYRAQVYRDLEAMPPRPVALVLGAGLWSDGSLTPILADRVATAADLYQAGKVEKLLCSGDNRRVDYNEPAAMKRYAVQLGVPEEDLVLDYAGRRTYDSCYRARAIFGVERAVVVTQRFHAARSLYTCEALGVDTVAVTADRRVYAARRVVWETREYLALVLAWWDVNVRRPTPVLGEPEPIEVSAAD